MDIPEDKQAVLAVLESVKDPEIPVLSVVDMGIVRDVRVLANDSHDKIVEVDITPTYSGCPAMKVIEDDVRQALLQAGWESVRVRLVYQPAWTTAWMSAEARARLRDYGIAPPQAEVELVQIGRGKAPVCPYCGSSETELRSEFGSTACKALYYCNSCIQPFEYFKSV